MSPRQFHAIMSALLLIAYYLSGKFWALGLASLGWACLYILDVSIAVKEINRRNNDGDNGNQQDD